MSTRRSVMVDTLRPLAGKQVTMVVRAGYYSDDVKTLTGRFVMLASRIDGNGTIDVVMTTGGNLVTFAITRVKRVVAQTD